MYEFGNVTPDPELEDIVQQALNDEQVLAVMLADLSSDKKKEKQRFDSFQALLMIGAQYPEILYEHWDYLVELLNSGNNNSIFNAIHLIARITGVDNESRFDEIFDDYFNLLNHDKIAIAGQVAINAGRIAKVKPHLQVTITNRLLEIDNTKHTPQHKELLKTYAIESFDLYFEDIQDKETIVEFVKNQLTSTSPRTKKAAKTFLAKFDK